MAESVSGHCLCGNVRFECSGEPKWQMHCHCESCRRNCSAPFTSYLAVVPGQWLWTGETPAHYSHTTGASRFFCSRCGTPMGYSNDEWPGEMHFYAASLTDPNAYRPECHDFYAERLPWIELADGLPTS